jgi:hypothetical protein
MVRVAQKGNDAPDVRVIALFADQLLKLAT